MELRKDPITRSWCMTGEGAETQPQPEAVCRFCAASPAATQVVSTRSPVAGGPWAARSVVHPRPMYRVEGEPSRRAEGLYDKMASVGAHEVLVENSHHDRHLWTASPAEIEQFLLLAGHRIQDLKRDPRFKYVTVFKDGGRTAGQEFEHPTSQLTATTFVPRRVLYELRASREYFQQKERCVFCDILQQEERQGVRLVEVFGDYIVMCPYASRAPYETWILPRQHESGFERLAIARPHSLRDLASVLRRTLNRIRGITEDFHMVLHTSPNATQRSQVLNYWKTIDDDYHWHIEFMPVVFSRAKPYALKEVYSNVVPPEEAAARLREAPTG